MADTPSAQAAIAAEIAKLRGDYVARLPDEISALAALAERLDDTTSQRPLVDELHHRLHKLAGSGGTFGLRKLSEAARHLEQTTNGWLAGNKPDAAARQSFMGGIAALTATLAETGITDTPTLTTATPALTNEGQPITIWLVEDDEPLGKELQRLLTQFGYDVSLFTRVADAEAAAQSARPSVLLMDVLFPEEGINATEAMGRLPALKSLNCPLLFISAQRDFQSRAQAARLGAEAFLTKPVDVTRLVARLEQLFGESRAAPYRVLIVDDDVQLSEHFRLVLTSVGMDVSVLNQPDQVIERVSAFRPELILMDMHMPGYSGPELATVIRYHDEWLGLPIVYLSAETSLDAQIKALGHGADDFITKPISDSQLASAVLVRAQRSRQLANLMSKDSLTGLLKHSLIKEEIGIEVERARRGDKPLSVVMTDIDHFKRVNDTYGHAVGDQVIRAIAHLLRQRLRKTDVIGRYGGEEFAAALPDCDAATARGIMDDIRNRFAALRFNHNDQAFACTLSAGIASVAGRQDCSGNELLIEADEALYRAKHGGRNQICVAGDPA